MPALAFRTAANRLRNKATARRLLECESLEGRIVPSLTPVTTGDAAAVRSVITIPWHGQPVKAYANEWVVHFDNLVGDRVAQAAQIESRLATLSQPVCLDKVLTSDGIALLTVSGSLAPEAALQLLRNAGTSLAEPNLALSVASVPNDPYFSQQWNLQNTGQTINNRGGVAGADVNAPAAWNTSLGSNSVVVAVLDTGIDLTHPDLVANLYVNPGEIPGNGIDDDHNGFIDDVSGWNFVDDTNLPQDGHHHGTMVSGIIAATANNGIGITGIAPNVKILPLKFIDDTGNGSLDGAIYALDYANMLKQNGVNIVASNNSWGDGFSDELDAVIQQSRDLGMLFVASSGNNNSDNDGPHPFYPASATEDNVISVTASDNQDQRPGFANWGLTSVDIAAPGLDIYTTQPGGGYGFGSGTSFAAPHVAAAAALLASISPAATYQQIRSAIFAGGDPDAAFATNGATPIATGKRLDLAGAIQSLDMGVTSTVPAIGGVVASAPTAFDVAFIFPFDAATLDASDLHVNDVPADSVSVIDSTTARFTFASTPVTTQGLQTMTMAAGVVHRFADGNPSIAFNKTFRYDATTLAIASTTPTSPGGVITMRMGAALRLTFNEAVDPVSVSVNDFGVSQGTVSNVAFGAGNTTIDLTLASLTTPGAYHVWLGAGAVADAFGNPLAASFTGSFQLALPPPPTIASVAPFIGPTSGGNTVVIVGAGFIDISAVKFAGVSALSFTVNSETQLTAVAPAHSPATIDVTVVNPGGASATAGAANDYTYAQPALTSVVVNGGTGQIVDTFGGHPNLAGQQSIVQNLLVTFNERVRLDANAFTLTSLAAVVTASVATPSTAAVAITAMPSGSGNVIDGYTQYILTFASGAGVNDFNYGTPFTTLRDGLYQLNVIGSRIHAGVADTAADRSDRFWSLYAAVDPADITASTSLGDGASTLLVDGIALSSMYAAFGSFANVAGPPAYAVSFDWNLDGIIDGIDLGKMYANFGTIWRF